MIASTSFILKESSAVVELTNVIRYGNKSGNAKKLLIVVELDRRDKMASSACVCAKRLELDFAKFTIASRRRMLLESAR